MTGGLDEVDASVDPVVHELDPVDPVLLLEVGIEPSLDIVDDGLPATHNRTNASETEDLVSRPTVVELAS